MIKKYVRSNKFFLKEAILVVNVYYCLINKIFFNKLMKFLMFNIYKIFYKIHSKKEIKLHLGCGNVHKKGFINIDIMKTKATDLVCDIKKLPFRDNSIELIETYHAIEHITHTKIKETLLEWNRVLKRGGKLIIECPNFDKAIEEYLNGNEFRLFNIFGLQHFKSDIHLFGYNFIRLKKLLNEAGFSNIQEEEPQDYHKDQEPCMRVICSK